MESVGKARLMPIPATINPTDICRAVLGFSWSVLVVISGCTEVRGGRRDDEISEAGALEGELCGLSFTPDPPGVK